FDKTHRSMFSFILLFLSKKHSSIESHGILLLSGTNLVSPFLSVFGWSYHYSNTTMNWNTARQWCRDRFTDMVAIQNHGEIDHLNTNLPRVSGYYWIGLRKINNSWTWVGTNKKLTEEKGRCSVPQPGNQGPPCVESACSPCVCVAFLPQPKDKKVNGFI
uniref:C-type lectin domain-containing protein n=1 Tax=Pygocentrus nattereri TaxID=42514 RepID=A0AAR2L3T7_PYGNA